MKQNELLIFILVILALLVVIGIITYAIITSQTHSKHYKERIRQLTAQEKKQVKETSTKTQDDDIRAMIDRITKPVSDGVLSYHKLRKAERDRRELAEAGLDKYFNPISWAAFRIILAVGGVILGVIFSFKNVYAGIAIAAILVICPTWLIKDSYRRRQEKLLSKFPSTIRIISGYLSANKSMPDAFLLAARTAAPMWKPFLETFSAMCDTDGEIAALNWLRKEVDIEEAGQFFSTIRLSLESGLNATDAFEKNAKYIDALLEAQNEKEIEHRKTQGTIVKGPLMLIIILVIALPIVGTFMDLFS